METIADLEKHDRVRSKRTGAMNLQ